MMRKAFTLMEVNLAILIMAGGILSIVGLYSLGFRENRQSAEDVASAAYADAVLSPLVAALSSPDVTWDQFNQIRPSPDERGWAAYFNSDGIVVNNPEGQAKSVFLDLLAQVSASGVQAAWPSSASGNLMGGLIVTRKDGSAVVGLGFRAAKQAGMLLSAPLYYTEVRFQGSGRSTAAGGATGEVAQ